MVNAETTAVRVLVCYSAAPRCIDSAELLLPQGATVADALRASGVLARHELALDALAGQGLVVGVWGRSAPLDTVLRDDDRVELWRGLKVDPKEARRQRYRRQPKG